MKRISPEQSIVAVALANTTQDAKRLIIAGLRNGDPETVFLAIQRAKKVVGNDAATRGALILIDQFMLGTFESEGVDTW